jgi:hypothetical protein
VNNRITVGFFTNAWFFKTKEINICEIINYLIFVEVQDGAARRVDHDVVCSA